MENDIAKAKKTAEKEQKKLALTSAAKKAEGIASLDGASEDGSGGSGTSGSQEDDMSGQGAEDEEKSGEVKNITADLMKRAPEEVFKKFDTDGSGLIDFDEFRAMLPQLGINISMPKVKSPVDPDRVDKLSDGQKRDKYDHTLGNVTRGFGQHDVSSRRAEFWSSASVFRPARVPRRQNSLFVADLFAATHMPRRS